MSFYNPVKIINFYNSRKKLVRSIENKNVLIICSKSALRRIGEDVYLKNLIGSSNILFDHGFSSNPSINEIKILTKKYMSKDFDLIVGYGGGSAMDVAKILSIMIPAAKMKISIDNAINDPDLINSLSCIDSYQVPTTAGTGSEVTPFATIWDYELNQKKSLSHIKMFPKKAYIDCSLIQNLPIEILQSTVLDALNQAFESLWNKNANDLTKLYAMKAIELSFNALKNFNENYLDKTQADMLSTASLYAGIAISQTRTAICHSISYPLTLRFGMPHGFACAFTMLEVLEFNKQKIHHEIKILENNLNLNVKNSLIEIFNSFNINETFKFYIKNKKHVFEILDQMITEGRFENNIRKCSKDDLVEIVTKSCNMHL